MLISQLNYITSYGKRSRDGRSFILPLPRLGTETDYKNRKQMQEHEENTIIQENI